MNDLPLKIWEALDKIDEAKTQADQARRADVRAMLEQAEKLLTAALAMAGG